MNLISWIIIGITILSFELSIIVCWKLRLFDGRWFPEKLREWYTEEKKQND